MIYHGAGFQGYSWYVFGTTPNLKYFYWKLYTISNHNNASEGHAYLPAVAAVTTSRSESLTWSLTLVVRGVEIPQRHLQVQQALLPKLGAEVQNHPDRHWRCSCLRGSGVADRTRSEGDGGGGGAAERSGEVSKERLSCGVICMVRPGRWTADDVRRRGESGRGRAARSIVSNACRRSPILRRLVLYE